MTPAWHDAPPVPGIYTIRYPNGKTEHVHIEHPDEWAKRQDGYYGPRDSELPDPPPIPEPPKPPLHFNAKTIGPRREDITGIIFPNGRVRVFYAINGNTDCDGLKGMDDIKDLYRDIEVIDGAPA